MVNGEITASNPEIRPSQPYVEGLKHETHLFDEVDLRRQVRFWSYFLRAATQISSQQQLS